MRVLAIVMVVILAVLIVHAAAYGIGFLADPDGGLGEFGYRVADTANDDANDDANDAARSLIRFIGIAMLGLAAFTVVVAWLIGSGARAGLWLALALGATRLAVASVAALDDHLRFDALFFAVTGLLVTVGAVALWALGRAHPRATPV